MRLSRALLLSAVVFVCLMPAPSNAQEVEEGEVVRVATSLVKVPVSARDREGRYVSDLKKEDFRLYDDGAEQRIAHFGDVEEPVSTVLLIDVSCSILKPEDTRAAALAFVEQMRPADSALPVTFGKEISPLLPAPTRDHAVLRRLIAEALPDRKPPDKKAPPPCEGATRLGDAVEFVIQRVLKGGEGRMAVVLLTDGRDSKASRPGWGVRTLHDVSELGVPFYSIRLHGRIDQFFGGWPGDSLAERSKNIFINRDLNGYIDDLATFSGGRSYPIASGETLKNYFEQIGEELRHQYVLAYYPGARGTKEARRKIKVRVNRRGVSVRARDSYVYVPPGD